MAVELSTDKLAIRQRDKDEAAQRWLNDDYKRPAWKAQKDYLLTCIKKTGTDPGRETQLAFLNFHLDRTPLPQHLVEKLSPHKRRLYDELLKQSLVKEPKSI